MRARVDDEDGLAMRIALAVLPDVARSLEPPLQPMDALTVLVPHPEDTLAALHAVGAATRLWVQRASVSKYECRLVVQQTQVGRGVEAEAAVHVFHVRRTTVDTVMACRGLPEGIRRYVADTRPASADKSLLLAATRDGLYQVRWVRHASEGGRTRMTAASAEAPTLRRKLRMLLEAT
jgi:hypothetical protein